MPDLIALIISLGKDVLVAAVAVVCAVVSILGLQTWRKQIRGKTEYELARRLLRCVYKTRDAIYHVRNPFMSAAEIQTALGDEEQPQDIRQATELSESKGVPAAYEKRWEKLSEALSDLSVESLEAEVLWGSVINDALVPLYDKIGDLRNALEDHLSIRRGDYGPVDPEERKRIRAIVYARGKNSAKDSFGVSVREAAQKAEEFVKPHLRI